ncbi:hypothetical protein BDA99DRAFT_480492 [Phascolomyces articulosus]|uniref:Uncharacterized protein n=1 Tax=Phascolomyces articulosus TaxID=60185 RepID=A0AAD5K2Y5_9FUNG|nr:hypothetical protein BDA99DRAFT_480492 [Phascolomyces articulosus]
MIKTHCILFIRGTQSLIVDPLDPAWDAYFTDQERDEISATNPLQLSPLTLEMVQYLKKFENMVGYLDDIFDTTSKDHFNPKKNADLYWLKQSITNTLELYYCDFFGKEVQSESDSLHHIWRSLYLCFVHSTFHQCRKVHLNHFFLTIDNNATMILKGKYK